MIKGVDVSGYQSATSFSLSGIDFVIVKVTEGLTYTNPKWTAQRDYAEAHGLVWGAYHYPHMANDPIAEAKFFLKQVSWKPGDIVVLDWEGYDAANKGVSNAKKLSYRDAWLKYVKAQLPNNRVGIYCNVDYWKNIDKTSNCGDFLWIATGGRPAGSPGITYPWKFHQYSTANNIDHDVANFASRAALAEWAGAKTPAPKPETGVDVALTDAQAKQLAQVASDTAAIRANLLSIGSLDAKDAAGEAVKHAAGYYLAYAAHDAKRAADGVNALTLGGVDLDALAAKVADLLAARLAN